MIFVLSKNLYLPERFSNKQRQRGSIILASQSGSIAQGQPAGTVTLSGENVNDPGESGVEVGIRFNSDGTVDRMVDGTPTQADSGTDWIIPNGAAPDLFEVMTDNWADIGGDPSGFENSAANEGVWIALTSNRLWSVLATASGGANSNEMTFDAHIRWKGGATIDSGSYYIDSTWFE